MCTHESLADVGWISMCKLRLESVLIAAAILAFGCAPAPLIQKDLGTLEVEVRRSDTGEVVTLAEVQIMHDRPQAPTLATLETDGAGKVRFESLSAGSYKLIVIGYFPSMDARPCKRGDGPLALVSGPDGPMSTSMDKLGRPRVWLALRDPVVVIPAQTTVRRTDLACK